MEKWQTVLLNHLLEGTIKNIPFVGDFIWAIVESYLEDKYKSSDAAILKSSLNELKGQSKTLIEIVHYVKEQGDLSKQSLAKLDSLLSAISEHSKGNRPPFMDDVEHALQNSIVNSPMNAYLADLSLDLRTWRGLGLSRPVSVEEIFVPPFLSVEREEKASSEVLENMLTKQTSSHSMLLEGVAGSGKSSLLKYLALTCIERTICDVPRTAQSGYKHKSYIPIYLPLASVESVFRSENNWTFSIPEIVARRFGKNDNPTYLALKNELNVVIESHAGLILLDGADEIPNLSRSAMREWLQTVFRSVSGNRLILTSRPSQYAEGFQGVRRYSLCPFSSEQQSQLIINWFKSSSDPEASKKMLAYLKRDEMFKLNCEAVFGNPLFLTMMCVEFEETDKISRSLAELLERFTALLLHFIDFHKGLQLKYGLELKRRVLESCASRFFNQGRTKFFHHELLTCIQETLDAYATSSDAKTIEEIIEEIEGRSGLLTQDRYCYGEWEFSHSIFQEFFTARHWWKKGKSEELYDWVGRVNNDPRYVSVMRFLTELAAR